MKKIILNLFIVFFSFLFLSSCKKVESDVLDYYPKVKTISATVLPDGSVEVKGEIISEGDAPIEYVGFCYDTSSAPKLNQGQAITSANDGNIFTVIYTGFEVQTKYFFRSWATNKYGYVYGNIISLDSISATPIIPPCSPTANTIDLGIGSAHDPVYHVTAPSLLVPDWEFSTSGNSTTMHFIFGSKPKTGIYSTTSSDTPQPDQVYASFYQGFFAGSFSSGGSVYVNQLGTNNWEITICNAPWNDGFSVSYLSGKFNCPL